MKKHTILALSFTVMVTTFLLTAYGSSLAALAPSQTDFPNASLLVSAESVQNSIGEENLIIIDARTEGYTTSHIPGAVNIRFGEFLTWGVGLIPIADLNNRLSAFGLKRSMTFVIYDNTSASWGAAGRIFWMLEYLGCKKVHILDGGWDKWVADERPTETTINTLPAAAFKASVKSSRIATKKHIKSRLYAADFAIIDSRNDEEFIGWQIYGEARGGHIPGAVQIPYGWFFNSDKTVLNYGDLRTVFESRGITRDKEVTAYCTVGVRSGFVYFLLRLMGYPNASNYDGSIAEWAATSSLPMKKAKNYRKLVYPQWVKNLIDGQYVPNAPAGKYVIAAASELDTVSTLIPGSIWISYNEVEWDSATAGLVYGSGNLWPDATLKANIEKMGIDKDTTVILYTANTQSYDPIGTTRIWWALLYAGVSDLRLLNGGITAWLASGYEVVATPVERTPVADFGTGPGEFPLHPEYLATTTYVEEVVAGQHPKAVITDIRSWQEYIGGLNDYASIGIPLTAVGRIPGARWGHWGPKTLVGGDFVDSRDGTLRSYPEVEKLWENWGITRDKTPIYYCGTAWRSTLGLFYGYLMGWPNLKNYDGSFLEWAHTSPNAANHAIQKGIPSYAPDTFKAAR